MSYDNTPKPYEPSPRPYVIYGKDYHFSFGVWGGSLYLRIKSSEDRSAAALLRTSITPAQRMVLSMSLAEMISSSAEDIPRTITNSKYNPDTKVYEEQWTIKLTKSEEGVISLKMRFKQGGETKQASVNFQIPKALVIGEATSPAKSSIIAVKTFLEYLTVQVPAEAAVSSVKRDFTKSNTSKPAPSSAMATDDPF